MSSRSTGLPRLQQIGSAFYSGEMSRDEARAAVIDVITTRLACSQVSLWRFDGEPGALRLFCVASKVRGGELVTRERTLLETEYRSYFARLVRSGVYVSDDTLADPDLQPMRESYLLASGVLSMLDAAFTVNGRIYGMVCCEQTDRLRSWRADEVTSLRALVAKLAMLMASAGDSVLQATPSLPMAPIRGALFGP